MKTQLMLIILAMTPALLAADPDSSTAPAPLATPPPIVQAEIADQAALVQQIGEAAANGFDPEAHAQALRAQIDALAAVPATAKSFARAAVPAVAAASKASSVAVLAAQPATRQAKAPEREAAIRETIQKLRSTLDELDAQLRVTRKGE